MFKIKWTAPNGKTGYCMTEKNYRTVLRTYKTEKAANAAAKKFAAMAPEIVYEVTK